MFRNDFRVSWKDMKRTQSKSWDRNSARTVTALCFCQEETWYTTVCSTCSIYNQHSNGPLLSVGAIKDQTVKEDCFVVPPQFHWSINRGKTLGTAVLLLSALEHVEKPVLHCAGIHMLIPHKHQCFTAHRSSYTGRRTCPCMNWGSIVKRFPDNKTNRLQ